MIGLFVYFGSGGRFEVRQSDTGLVSALRSFAGSLSQTDLVIFRLLMVYDSSTLSSARI